MAALWTAILVTLLSALVPQGLPASRQTGSAFSPATMTVALKARAAQPVAAAPRILPAPTDPPLAVLVAGVTRFAPLRLALARPVPPEAAHSDIFLLRAWRQPRAPPVPSVATP